MGSIRQLGWDFLLVVLFLGPKIPAEH
jgi:hypothetical protein